MAMLTTFELSQEQKRREALLAQARANPKIYDLAKVEKYCTEADARATYTLSMEECRAIQSGRPVTVPITSDTIQRIKDGLLAVVAQIEAEQKAAPVMNAIQATHMATRSDGRPHFYVDPLRKGD